MKQSETKWNKWNKANWFVKNRNLYWEILKFKEKIKKKYRDKSEKQVTDIEHQNINVKKSKQENNQEGLTS